MTRSRTRPIARAMTGVMLIVVVVVLASMPALPAAAAGPTAGVRGVVVISRTGAPISGATITLPAFGLETTSGADGSFTFDQPVPTAYPFRPIDVVVTAPGWASWTITGAPLRPNDVVILHAGLRSTPYVDRVPAPLEPGSGSKLSAPVSPTSITCTGWDYTQVPPPTIKVVHLRDGSGLIETVPFFFWATHVLPSEWGSTWDPDALAAGAMAVKTYGAKRATTGNAGYVNGQGQCADVRDNIDGYYDPNVETLQDTLAVEATYGSVAYQSGGVFYSTYFGGIDYPCAHIDPPDPFAGWMSQWGTKYCADAHMLWPDIFTTFYSNITWYYQHNLLLNPSITSNGMYPWLGGPKTALARTSGTGYDGSWYLAVSSTQPKAPATVYQQRPYTGTATTAYHAKVALRCPSSNRQRCKVTLEVVAVPTTGGEVSHSLEVIVPKTDTWGLVTFDPAAFGIAHGEVRFAVTSKQAIDVDAAALTTPYGGP